MANLTVVVGAPSMVAALPAGQVVVVEADIELARALKRELQELGALDRVLIAAEVLTADYNQPVLWFRFNDSRLNGPWPLDHWQGEYPNLVVQQVEERTGRSLAEVLDVWEKQMPVELGDQQLLMITLVLSQGDVLATLAGCGKWLRHVNSVQFNHPASCFSTQKTMGSWLSQRGFCPPHGKSLCWQRDPLYTLRFELEESREKIMQMEEQLSYQAVHILLAKNNSQEVTAERDNLNIEKEILLTGKQELAEQVGALSQQLDDLAHERDARTAERDNLNIEKEILLTEKQELAEQVEALSQQLDDLAHERDTRTAERDNLHIEKEILLTEKQELAEQVGALSQQLDDLAHERDTRTAERDNLHIEKEILLTEKQELAEQVGALSQQLDDLAHERDTRTEERDNLHIEKEILLTEKQELTVQQEDIKGINSATHNRNKKYKHHPHAHLLEEKYNLPIITSETHEDKFYKFAKKETFASAMKLIAFYLPQFHPFEENNQWWGKGFTEWTNVGKAKPLFDGHYQPHCPIHLGYYDLRITENMIEQAELAKNYGISGFAYYVYWFNGKTIMEKPLNNMLKEPRVDMPFCIAWANENWTRRWDGQEEDILISQKHSLADSMEFLKHMQKYFLDNRYICHENKPIIIIYRADIIPDISLTIKHWREMAVEMGFAGLYLVAAQTFGIKDPTDLGFDAAVEFPPHDVHSKDVQEIHTGINNEFTGCIYDYREIVSNKLNDSDPAYNQHYTCMFGWDNVARKEKQGNIFSMFSLGSYQNWLHNNLSKTIKMATNKINYPLISFVNAWNEWAEGTHLEPDQAFGYGYLESTHAILKKFNGPTSFYKLLTEQLDPRQGNRKPRRICIIIHCYYIDVFEKIFRAITLHINMNEVDLYVTTDSIEKAMQIKAITNESIITIAPNHGRDILPFINFLRSLKIAEIEYQISLKLHTKKSEYRSDGHILLEKNLNNLVSNTAMKIVERNFQENPKLGLIVSDVCFIEHKTNDGERMIFNEHLIKEICDKIGIEFKESKFPVGSMFWYRQSALMRLIDIDSSHFHPEIGLPDGTAAHAIERLFSEIVKFEGYDILEI